MKTIVAIFLFSSLLAAGLLLQLTPKEKECIERHGIPLDTFELVSAVICDYEDKKLSLRLFLRCALEGAGLMNNKGELIPDFTSHPSIRKVIESVPVLEDKNDYAFKLGQKRLLSMYRSVPPNCKGNLTKAWLKCAKDNGLPELTTIETLRKIRANDEPSENFKKFLLCGLKDQEILTENGDVNMESLELYDHQYTLMKMINQTTDYKDRADFAYKITKAIVQRFTSKDLLAQADNLNENIV